MSDRLVDAAAAALGLQAFDDVTELRLGDRSRVLRVRTGDTSYVVKGALTDEGDTWARENAALSALEGLDVGPALVAAASDPPLIVMADLGEHPSVADAVLGRDPGVADRAVDAWSDAVADLHGATGEGVLATFARRLAALAPHRATHGVPGELEWSLDSFQELAAAIDLPVPAGFADELLALPDRFRCNEVVLTSGDCCPDNNALVGGRALLHDFEFAEIRHVAWDVAYLRVPWPTCWCAWRLPDAVAARGIARYRERLAPRIPYVASDDFLHDLDVATVGWCLMSTSWWIGSALDEDTHQGGEAEGPSTRPKLLHRLWLAGRLPAAPGLTSYAHALHRTLVRRWGDPALVLAPAWRDEDIAIP